MLHAITLRTHHIIQSNELVQSTGRLMIQPSKKEIIKHSEYNAPIGNTINGVSVPHKNLLDQLIKNKSLLEKVAESGFLTREQTINFNPKRPTKRQKLAF
jgi:hypothetical protein